MEKKKQENNQQESSVKKPAIKQQLKYLTGEDIAMLNERQYEDHMVFREDEE